ncbi:CPBP family intramembrane glutamic endopeptidase [Clostridium tertium]
MIIYFISLLFYPSLYEEFLFRGFFIGGIKKFKLDDNWINIIQALVFGLIHYNQFSQYGILGILGSSNQILIGFLLGQVYYYTGSLTPSIIIHAFCDLLFL